MQLISCTLLEKRGGMMRDTLTLPSGQPETNAHTTSPMASIWRRLEMVAKTPLPVLIVGETGAGKELAADWLFSCSGRGLRLLKVNCAGLSESLVESELFGHVRGAFTGAHAARTGLFEAADGGSLFLDEVGELPLATQAKLLRALESGEVTRLGSNEARKVDVRIVAATHRDLPSRIRAGAFREDLYFRLNGLSIRIPPLRERRGEIVPLARGFIERFSARVARPAPTLALCAETALRAHPWPGNVRELRHTLERCVALLDSDAGCILAEHLELHDQTPETRVSTPEQTGRTSTLRTEWLKLERAEIMSALEQCGGNQKCAAELLGISRRSLTNKLNAHSVPRPRKRSA
jgi:transcriptional regulator with GAF, ATPase, and Fis domain